MDTKLKDKIGKIFNDLFEMIIWFVIFMSTVLAWAFVYVAPKAGICAILWAVFMTYAPRIINKFKHKEEN